MKNQEENKSLENLEDHKTGTDKVQGGRGGHLKPNLEIDHGSDAKPGSDPAPISKGGAGRSHQDRNFSNRK